jgi:uracil-DNA glycosylase
MGALSGLVDRGLLAPDWAEALAPFDERIGAMGGYLRA